MAKVSNYVCLACSSIHLLQIHDKVNNTVSYQCPNCGKSYYPKMHTMRKDPTTIDNARLQTKTIMQKGILSLDDKRAVMAAAAAPTKLTTQQQHSPMIRYISTHNINPKDKTYPYKKIRMTKYMRKEGSYFKQKRVPQEVINMGVEIISFKETIE